MEISGMPKVIKPSVGVAVITHHAVKHLPRCLPAWLNSPLKPKVLVVNSSSNDGTVELAKAMGAETLLIPRHKFNHGSTREKARQHLKTDIVVMVTPDAYAEDHHVLEKLILPLQKNQASISYARQIPHEGANFFESFPRKFNYPLESHIRGINDIKQHGVYTFFCSNSCAAYKNSALEEINGFKSVLLGEDTLVVAHLLQQGHKIAYVAEAVVKHSHRYSLKEEFKRNFDTGLARVQHRPLLSLAGSDTKRGLKYVKSMLSYLLKNKPSDLPYAFVQILTKWVGYKMGALSLKAPLWVKMKCTSQDFYWKSEDFLSSYQNQ
jgi:rhamnosyltransferase